MALISTGSIATGSRIKPLLGLSQNGLFSDEQAASFDRRKRAGYAGFQRVASLFLYGDEEAGRIDSMFKAANSRNQMQIWTPPESMRTVGSVKVDGSQKQFTRTEYMFLQMQRINALVAKETPEKAAVILRRYEEIEKFSLKPGTAAEILAENSEWLRERSGFSPDLQIEDKRLSPAYDFYDDETLEDFLAMLYYEEAL